MTMVPPVQKPQAAPQQKQGGQAAQFVSEGGGGEYALDGAAAGPGGIAQRKLQAMADASPRAAQLKSMQAKIQNPVAQLAPIVNPNQGVAQLDELDSPLNHSNPDYEPGSTDSATKNPYSTTPTGKFSDESSADKRAAVDAKRGDAKVHQPVADLGELYAHSSMLKPEYDNQVASIASATKGKTKFRSGEGMKNLGRSMEKIVSDYDGDASRIIDLTGASIYYDSIDDLINGYQAVEGNSFFNVVRVKNTLAKAEGYGDINIAVEMGSADFDIDLGGGQKKKEHYPGFIIELQLHLTAIIQQKEVGHKQYEEQRKITAKYPGKGRAAWSPEAGVPQQDIDDYDRLDKEMHDIYAKGWSKLITWGDFLNPFMTDKLEPVRKKLSQIPTKG